jgi:hypothetical protein
VDFCSYQLTFRPEVGSSLGSNAQLPILETCERMDTSPSAQATAKPQCHSALPSPHLLKGTSQTKDQQLCVNPPDWGSSRKEAWDARRGTWCSVEGMGVCSFPRTFCSGMFSTFESLKSCNVSLGDAQSKQWVARGPRRTVPLY